jgi:hypothetical protein
MVEKLLTEATCCVGRPPMEKKGGVSVNSPFLQSPTMLNLELISIVQTPICPASTTPSPAVVFNPEVSLYGRGQI